MLAGVAGLARRYDVRGFVQPPTRYRLDVVAGELQSGFEAVRASMPEHFADFLPLRGSHAGALAVA